METAHDYWKLPLECYDAGELAILMLREAVTRLCQANYGFVAPLNRITWQVDGHRGWNDIYAIAGEKPTSLGLYTYIHHGQPFTIDDAEALINSRNELTKELFISWAAKFNRGFRGAYHGKPLPKELWPFRYVKTFVSGSGRIMRPAYQMSDNRSSFVVVGPDRDKVDNSVISWSFMWRQFQRKWQV